MRVLQIAARMLTIERFALPLMRQLREAGFVVEALGQFDGHEAPIRAAGFPIHPWTAGHTFNPWRCLRARRELKHFLRTHSFDLIHTHGAFGGTLANPVVHRCGIPLIFTKHGFYVHPGLGPMRRFFWLEIEKIGLRAADYVFCVSQAEQTLAQSLGVGPPEKFLRLPGAGVDLRQFQRSEAERLAARQRLRNELGVGEETFVILSVARLKWDKGYRELIEAARQLQAAGYDFVIWAAGTGAEEAAIRQAIARAGVDSCFQLLGWRSDVPELYCAADLFVLPSHREGLPIAPIEAMASGLPVVLSDIPGCREVADEGRAGLLFPTGNAEKLAACLEKMLTDHSFRQALAEAGRERAQAFSVEKALAPQLALYQELARGIRSGKQEERGLK